MIAFAINGGGEVTLRDPHLTVIGYAGRDRGSVERHIAELELVGIPRPPRVPMVWRLPAALLTQSDTVTVPAGRTSGEVEPVLIIKDGRRYLTVGSDHTDRLIEKTSIEASKRVCPKPVSRFCLPLDDLEHRWDDLLLSSSLTIDWRARAYQHGTLDELLPLADLLGLVDNAPEVVVFCGTVAADGELETCATAFTGELHDPSTGMVLSCSYRIHDSAASLLTDTQRVG